MREGGREGGRDREGGRGREGYGGISESWSLCPCCNIFLIFS